MGAGAAMKKTEERNNIQWMELEKPGFTVIGGLRIGPGEALALP